MRRVQTIITRECDFCIEESAKVVEAVAEFTVACEEDSRLRGSPRLVDTCDSHAKMLRALMAMMRKARTLAKTAREISNKDSAEPARIECSLCGRNYSRYELMVHLRKVHGIMPPDQPRDCPDCKRTITSPRGMVVHRQSAHAYNHIAEYLERAAAVRTPALPLDER